MDDCGSCLCSIFLYLGSLIWHSWCVFDCSDSSSWSGLLCSYGVWFYLQVLMQLSMLWIMLMCRLYFVFQRVWTLWVSSLLFKASLLHSTQWVWFLYQCATHWNFLSKEFDLFWLDNRSVCKKLTDCKLSY